MKEALKTYFLVVLLKNPQTHHFKRVKRDRYRAAAEIAGGQSKAVKSCGILDCQVLSHPCGIFLL